jgi:hypothetical protein
MRFTFSSVLAIGLAGLASVAACATQPTTLAGGTSQADNRCKPPELVQQVIFSCTDCHDEGGESPRLVTAADYRASGNRSLIRMKDKSSPMPPDKLPPSEQVTAFQEWANGGYQLTCPPDPSAGGAGGGGGGVSEPSAGGAAAVAP